MESSDADESEGEKSASGMEMKKRASSKDLESPDDENSDGIALEEKEIMPLVQKKGGRSRSSGPKFSRVQVHFWSSSVFINQINVFIVAHFLFVAKGHDDDRNSAFDTDHEHDADNGASILAG